jgi:hypothetical protein
MRWRCPAAVVELLLAAGADADCSNESGDGMLLQALQTGAAEPLPLLLAKALNVNRRGEMENFLLTVALEAAGLACRARAGFLKAAKALPAAGAEATVVSRGGSPVIVLAADLFELRVLKKMLAEDGEGGR